jgi:adenylate cyclase
MPRSALTLPRSFRVLGFALIAAAALGMHYTDLLALLNGKLLDAGFTVWRAVAPRPLQNDVVVIGIDVEDLRTFNEPRELWHPNYARLFEALAQAKPAVVGLDVVFPERSYQHLIPGLDQALLKGLMAIRAVAPVILARTIDDAKNFREIFAPYVAIAGPDSVGTVVVCRDDDEVIRRFDEYLCDPHRVERIPGLAGVMARRQGVDGDWRGLIDYRIGDRIEYVPFREVLRWAEAQDPRLRTRVEGHAVLLGFVLPFDDRKTVPVDLALWEPGNHSVPGVLVHAQVLRSLLNGGLLQSVGAWAIYALVLLGAALVFAPSGALASGAYVLFMIALGAGGLLLMGSREVLQIAAPALAATGALSWRFVTESIAQASERATLRHAFAGYVSPQIMNEILTGRLMPELGGKREQVCILFSDVRNFTSRSEYMAPEALINMLNEYFTEMTQSVHSHGGTVDKFIGDGMMCFFGAPQPLANPAVSAEAAARDMLERLVALNQRFRQRGFEPLQIGIGLHMGEVVLGHVGSATRHEYTAIGDAVNTASRIEGLTKTLGYALLISNEVWAELANRQDYMDLGRKSVKGRSSVAVYGLSESQSEVDNEEKTWNDIPGSR